MPNLPMRKKLIIAYLLLAVLPTLFLGMYLSTSIRSITVNTTISDAKRNVEIIQAEFSQALSGAIDLSMQIYISRNFMGLIEGQFDTTWEVVETYFDFTEFDQLRKIYANSICNIRVFVDNPTILGGWHLYHIDEAVRETDWYIFASQNPSRVFWGPTWDEHAFSQGFELYSLARFYKTDDHLVGILIDINRERINSLLSTEYFDTVIIDGRGHIVSANNLDKAYSIAQQYGFDQYGIQNGTVVMENNIISGLGMGPHKIIMRDIRLDGVNGNFRIISTFLLDDILRESNQIFSRSLIIISLCIIFMGTLLIWFSQSLTKRVAVLSNEMEKVSLGNFDLVSSLKGRDEIGILSARLNTMVQNLKSLHTENSEINIQKQELLAHHNDIKLRLLSNQMNPHFLFNVLESIRMEAHSRHEGDIANIIERLGSLLHKSTYTSNEEWMLAEELKIVEDYLLLQKFRYGERIGYDLYVSEEIRGLYILPFSIQPLVENAIIHGIENIEQNGMITISVHHHENELHIVVKDNGIGISPERLTDIHDGLNSEHYQSDSIGMRNVHWRIRLFYGPPYGLIVESEEGQYTKVSLCVPVR